MNGGIMTLQLQKTQTEDAKEWNVDDMLLYFKHYVL